MSVTIDTRALGEAAARSGLILKYANSTFVTNNLHTLTLF
jgi:hypothetical protein